ncbi:MAG: hypothetical protein JRN52_08335 [Nitrososphaerota archaeon]|nr:hypothetical protein [Nitrososphaerota archaeon]
MTDNLTLQDDLNRRVPAHTGRKKLKSEVENSQSDEMKLVLGLLESACERIDDMHANSGLRDIARIWETYCDVEMAIGLAKHLGSPTITMGSYRRVKVSGKSDPSIAELKDLEKEFALIKSEVISSKTSLLEGRKSDSIELARKARDRLKAMLLSNRKNSFKKK